MLEPTQLMITLHLGLLQTYSSLHISNINPWPVE